MRQNFSLGGFLSIELGLLALREVVLVLILVQLFIFFPQMSDFQELSSFATYFRIK